MEKARQEYKNLTGADPKNLVVLGDETGRKFAEQFALVCGDGAGYDPNTREMEFIKVKRTADGYSIRLIDVHRREDGHYTGVNLDVGHVLLEEVGPAIKALNIGDSATYCLKGIDVSEIVRKRHSYLKGKKQRSAKKKVDRVLSREHLTESQLIRNHAFEIKGNDRDGYVADVRVGDPLGMHARPAAQICKIAGQYDCDVFIKKNGNTVSAKSILGMLTLDAPHGTDLILEAEGPGAKDCLEDLVALFQK